MNIIRLLARKNIRDLTPYSSARDEFKGTEGHYIFLDANESPDQFDFAPGYNRYPESKQLEVRTALAEYLGVTPAALFLTNGSDEGIDLLFRAFCEPGKENAIIFTPTYGVYQFAAERNGVELRKADLTSELSIDHKACKLQVDENTKLIFVCSPNNPTGNLIEPGEIMELFKNDRFKGLVVVDEAYIDFAPDRSILPLLRMEPRLVILRTFSKAWKLAAARLGVMLGSAELITLLLNVKDPYNVSAPSQRLVIEALTKAAAKEEACRTLVKERERLTGVLAEDPRVNVFPSDANFYLLKISDPASMYRKLLERGIVTRLRARLPVVGDALRVSVGVRAENDRFLNTFMEILEDTK